MAVPVIVTRPKWMTDFRDFIMRGSVVDLAVGIVIGVAFTGVINSLVKDIINPAIGLLTGGIDFSNYFIPLNGQHYATLEAARAAGAATVNIGLFVNSIINFLIISFAIFWIVKALTKLHVRKDPAPAGSTPSEILLTEIRDELRIRPPGEVISGRPT